MVNLTTEEILQEAKKIIKDPDVIVDVYDMTYVWVSPYQCELTEYSKEELIGNDLSINSELTDADISKMAPEVSHPNEFFEREIIIKTKSGKRKVFITKGIISEIGEHPYLVGRIEKVQEG